MFTSLVPGMKSDVNEEVVQWLHSEPKIVISTAKLGRTVDDLGTHERENREGKLPTVVDCYMKDKGVSKQEAINEFVELVENGWKDITAEWVKGSSSVPKEMMEQLLNYGRMAEITYTNKEDGFTYPEKYLGPLIASLFLYTFDYDQLMCEDEWWKWALMLLPYICNIAIPISVDAFMGYSVNIYILYSK